MSTVQTLIVGTSLAGGLNPYNGWQSWYRQRGQPTASFTFKTDGTCTTLGSILVSLGRDTTNWYLPTTAGIGNSWWIRVTETASVGDTVMTGQPLNTWLQLTSDRDWNLRKLISDPPDPASRDFSVDFSLDGSTVVGTGHLSLLVQYLI